MEGKTPEQNLGVPILPGPKQASARYRERHILFIFETWVDLSTIMIHAHIWPIIFMSSTLFCDNGDQSYRPGRHKP